MNQAALMKPPSIFDQIVSQDSENYTSKSNARSAAAKKGRKENTIRIGLSPQEHISRPQEQDNDSVHSNASSRSKNKKTKQTTLARPKILPSPKDDREDDQHSAHSVGSKHSHKSTKKQNTLPRPKLQGVSRQKQQRSISNEGPENKQLSFKSAWNEEEESIIKAYNLQNQKSPQVAPSDRNSRQVKEQKYDKPMPAKFAPFAEIEQHNQSDEQPVIRLQQPAENSRQNPLVVGVNKYEPKPKKEEQSRMVFDESNVVFGESKLRQTKSKRRNIFDKSIQGQNSSRVSNSIAESSVSGLDDTRRKSKSRLRELFNSSKEKKEREDSKEPREFKVEESNMISISQVPLQSQSLINRSNYKPAAGVNDRLVQLQKKVLGNDNDDFSLQQSRSDLNISMSQNIGRVDVKDKDSLIFQFETEKRKGMSVTSKQVKNIQKSEDNMISMKYNNLTSIRTYPENPSQMMKINNPLTSKELQNVQKILKENEEYLRSNEFRPAQFKKGSCQEPPIFNFDDEESEQAPNTLNVKGHQKPWHQIVQDYQQPEVIAIKKVERNEKKISKDEQREQLRQRDQERERERQKEREKQLQLKREKEQKEKQVILRREREDRERELKARKEKQQRQREQRQQRQREQRQQRQREQRQQRQREQQQFLKRQKEQNQRREKENQRKREEEQRNRQESLRIEREMKRKQQEQEDERSAQIALKQKMKAERRRQQREQLEQQSQLQQELRSNNLLKLNNMPSACSRQDSDNKSQKSNKSSKKGRQKKQNTIKIDKQHKVYVKNQSPRAQQSFYESNPPSNQQPQAMNQPKEQKKPKVISFDSWEEEKPKSKTDSNFYQFTHSQKSIKPPSSKPPLSKRTNGSGGSASKQKKPKEKTIAINVKEHSLKKSDSSKKLKGEKKMTLMERAMLKHNESNDSYSDESSRKDFSSSESRRSNSSKNSRHSLKKESTLNINLKDKEMIYSKYPKAPLQKKYSNSSSHEEEIEEYSRQSFERQAQKMRERSQEKMREMRNNEINSRLIVSKNCTFIDEKGRLVQKDLVIKGQQVYGLPSATEDSSQYFAERMRRTREERKKRSNSRQKNKLSRQNSREGSQSGSAKEGSSYASSSFYENSSNSRGNYLGSSNVGAGNSNALRQFIRPVEEVPMYGREGREGKGESRKEPKTLNDMFYRKNTTPLNYNNSNMSQSRKSLGRTERSLKKK